MRTGRGSRALLCCVHLWWQQVTFNEHRTRLDLNPGFETLDTHIHSEWIIGVYIAILKRKSLKLYAADISAVILGWISWLEIRISVQGYRQALRSRPQWCKHVFVCAWSKTPITTTMTFLFGRKVTVGLNLQDLLSKCVHTHKFTYVFYCLGWPATDSGGCSSHWQSDWMEGHVHGAMRGGMHVAGRWGFGGLLGGRLPTLCAPNPGESAGHCGSLLVHQPESWERGFQLRRADDKQVFFLNGPLWVSLLLFYPFCLFSLSLRFVLDAVSPGQL